MLVDSSVWIDYFRNAETPAVVELQRWLGRGRIVVGDLVLVEVLQGFVENRHFRTAEMLLTSLPQVAICTPALALHAAINYRALRRRGITVRKTIDTLIATWCIDNGQALLTSDRDFDPFFEHLGLERAQAA